MQNKREFTRFNLQHDALIIARGFTPVACDLANVCDGGMLLTNIVSSKLCHYLSENPASRIEVHLFCKIENKEEHYTILADVCRLEEHNTGIQFVHPQPQLTEILCKLQELNNGHGVLYTTSSKRTKLLKWFKTHGEQFVRQLLKELINQTDSELAMRIESSSDISEISILREARAVLAENEDYQKLFTDYWRAGLQRLIEGNATAPSSGSELTVIDKSQFEGWLEVQMVATSVLNRHRNQLYLLNQFLSQIFEQDMDDRLNPIAPGVIGQYLHSSFTCKPLPDAARPLIYKNFEKTLDRAYEDTLGSLFGIFQKHGLRAIKMDQLRSNWSDISQPRIVQPQSLDADEKTDALATESKDVSDASSANYQGEGNILNMVRLQRTVESGHNEILDSAANMAGSAATSIQPETVLAQHEEILRQLAEQNASIAGVLNSKSVAGNLGGDLNESDWDIAKLVDQIFAPVEQRQVNTDLKSLVNQLRLPLFTLLLSDQSFLQDGNHVARALLNDFMTLATADRVSSKNLEKLLRQVVEELTSSGDLSPELLKGLADRLNKLVKRQQMAFDRNAERIAKTYDGQDRLLSARRAVTRRINTLIGGKQTPDVILELLDAGWEHAMVLGLLKEGGDSETVVVNFAVLEQLYLWLSADADEDLIFEKELESPALLEQVQEELTTSPDPTRVRHVLQHLENLLYNDAEVTYTFVENYFSSDDPGLPVVSLEEGVDDRWQERAHQLAVGEWVEVVTPTGMQRMRLVWTGEDAFKFVFLTPKGMHEAHYDYTELVTKLQDGELIRVDQGEIPFIDQSLYGIVEDLYQKMAVQAVHDPLTGCMQRRELEKKLNYTIEKVKATGEPAALIVFDIDRFNVINSNQGTKAGDAVLQNFSVLVDTWLSGYAFEFHLGRIAGNEFALIVAPLDPELAPKIADKVRTKFSKHNFNNEDQVFSATLSSGVVLIDEHSADAGRLLNNGALVCKSVKKTGGDATLVYSPTDSDQVHQQEVLKWVAIIEESLSEENLFLRAQLISPLADGKLPLYEILLGVRDETGDVVSPAPFIEAGEAYNKSVQIDTWVVTTAIGWMRSNSEKLKKIGAFTINLSGSSLSDNQFMEFLEQQFMQGGFPAEKICFEVTETSAVANINYTADFMREIKRSGCKFALDDFGTGFSSYAYLQKLPVDYLKVDGSFVSDLHKNVTNYAMVKSISELAQFLKIFSIAECVEEQEGFDAIEKIGVDYVQGFLLGRPMLLTEL